MNLADMLCYADIRQLSSIANAYDCQCDGHSKNELIQSILSRLNRREVFERHVSDLRLEEIRFLNSILFESRDQFSLEELVARAHQCRFAKEPDEAWNPRDMIVRFKHKGWLFNGHSPQTKYLLQFPQDLKKRFAEVLADRFQNELEHVEEPAAYRDEQTFIVDDISHFLHHLYHNEMFLTADGSIHKRHLQLLLDRMAVKEELPKGGWRFGYGRKFKELPNRFSLIYDYCYDQRLIQETDGRLVLTEKGQSAVLEGRKEHPAQIYRYWLKLYKVPVPNIQTIVLWIEMLARDWVTVDSLGRALCKLIRPYYYDTPESIFEQRILQMMMHLGLVRIGEDERHGRSVRMTKLGRDVITGTYASENEKMELTRG